MIILGINAFEENPSACLVEDGKLLCFVEEERLARIKGAYGHFPDHAVRWCLKSQGRVLSDVNHIAVSWDCTKYPTTMLQHLLRLRLRLGIKRGYRFRSSINSKSNQLSVWNTLYLHTPGTFRQKIRDCLRMFGHKGDIPNIEFVPHHLSHAYQAYYQSPFKTASVLVIDGSGEENTVSGYAVEDGIFRKVLEYNIPQSLGWFYSGFTAYMGFQPGRDEAKLMGLAAYGEQKRENNPWVERLEKILHIGKEYFEIDPHYFKFGGNEFHSRFTDKLVNFMLSSPQQLAPISFDEKVSINGVETYKYFLPEYIELAYAVQDRLEKAIAEVVKCLIKNTGARNLCFSGGVAMNCKANGFLQSLNVVDNLFVHPASTDAGACIGAAFKIAYECGDNPRNILQHTQLGPKFSNDTIEQSLKTCKIDFKNPDDISLIAAELISQGKFIGWFSGGVEMGSRALGGRSIVAAANNKLAKDRINKEVKFRESWRPYCPSLTSESKNSYFVEAIETPTMIVAQKANKRLIDSAPSVVHVDNTVRPQTVEKNILPKWHHFLKCVERKCGEPMVLNTSFNVRNEPIVCSPSEALRCFYSTGLDALVLEDYLICKDSAWSINK